MNRKSGHIAENDVRQLLKDFSYNARFKNQDRIKATIIKHTSERILANIRSKNEMVREVFQGDLDALPLYLLLDYCWGVDAVMRIPATGQRTAIDVTTDPRLAQGKLDKLQSSSKRLEMLGISKVMVIVWHQNIPYGTLGYNQRLKLLTQIKTSISQNKQICTISEPIKNGHCLVDTPGGVQYAKDYSGTKYNSLTALSYVGPVWRTPTVKSTMWQFKCDCGETEDFPIDDVVSEKIKTCSTCESKRANKIVLDIAAILNFELDVLENFDGVEL